MTTVDDRPTTLDAARPAAARRSIWHRLYHGETNFDFVGKRRIGFTISAVLIVISARLAVHPRASTSASTSRAAWPGSSRPTA